MGPNCRSGSSSSPLADDRHHLGNRCDLDARTSLGAAGGSLVPIKDLPIAIGHIVDASLTEERLDPRRVTAIVAESLQNGQVGQHASTVAAESDLLFPISPVGPRLAHPTT